jgi:hypothetical protein
MPNRPHGPQCCVVPARTDVTFESVPSPRTTISCPSSLPPGVLSCRRLLRAVRGDGARQYRPGQSSELSQHQEQLAQGWDKNSLSSRHSLQRNQSCSPAWQHRLMTCRPPLVRPAAPLRAVLLENGGPNHRAIRLSASALSLWFTDATCGRLLLSSGRQRQPFFPLLWPSARASVLRGGC